MNPTKWIAEAYDAIAGTKKRRPAKVRVRHEDKEHPQKDRKKGIAAARDAVRNFALTRWAVNKHLDYVASFSFQAKTGDPALDAELERMVAEWSDRNNCDVARRHPLRRLIRLAEARAIVDGDVGLLKINAAPGSRLRGALQAIEGDRIYTPNGMPPLYDPSDFVNGVRTTQGGAALEYCICKRDEHSDLVFSRVVPAANLFFHANYDRFDQVRGVSPLMAALNTMGDVYEGFDLALAKLKVSQLFSLATYRAGNDVLGEGFGEDVDGDGSDDRLAVDFGKGPIHLDLDAEDRAEILDAKTPATETVAFLHQMMGLALKALDIPYSFFDESHTNFNGSHRAEIGYIKSCGRKRADLVGLLNEITRWRVGLWVADGELAIPAGLDFTDIKWEWVPDGMPWWNPLQQVKGQTMAIAAALTDFQRVARETGSDFYDNVDRIAEQQEYARERGVDLRLAGVMSGDASPTDQGGDGDE